MAKKSDVELTVTGLSGVTPVGVSINHSVGSIPTATIDLAPDDPGVIKILGGAKGVLADVDQAKRKEEITINISTKTYTGKPERDNNSLEFVGYLDGLSLGNTVGGNSYQAIIKGKQQVLLEITTMTPGLYPTSINIYKIPGWGGLVNAQAPDQGAERAWGIVTATQGIKLDQPPIQAYTDILRELIDIQLNRWQLFVGTEKLVTERTSLEKTFNDPRYKKALTRAKEMFADIDFTAIEGGAHDSLVTSYPFVSGKLLSIFSSGSNILLENYMNFLSYMGCSLIFSNNKMYVIPINSMIKQPTSAPGFRQLQDEPNAANPADYNSYLYNDNGYRDILSVLVTCPENIGGLFLGGPTFASGALGEYIEEDGLTQASGVLVVPIHPFMLLAHHTDRPSDAKDAKSRLDSVSESMYDTKKAYESVKQQVKQAYVSRDKEKKESQAEFLKPLSDNYAEIKFYQARYADRQGTITMDFNPGWVPGTGGRLYIRETGMFIAFYVNSVTHRVDMSAPNAGTAMTIVNFNCGRIGSSPAGVSEDKFFGYDIGKEKKIQEAFLQDNKETYK